MWSFQNETSEKQMYVFYLPNVQHVPQRLQQRPGGQSEACEAICRNYNKYQHVYPLTKHIWSRKKQLADWHKKKEKKWRVAQCYLQKRDLSLDHRRRILKAEIH